MDAYAYAAHNARRQASMGGGGGGVGYGGAASSYTGHPAPGGYGHPHGGGGGGHPAPSSSYGGGYEGVGRVPVREDPHQQQHSAPAASLAVRLLQVAGEYENAHKRERDLAEEKLGALRARNQELEVGNNILREDLSAMNRQLQRLEGQGDAPKIGPAAPENATMLEAVNAKLAAAVAQASQGTPQKPT